MEATEKASVQEEGKTYLDDESRSVVKFFRVFNVFLLIFALIGTFWLAYTQAESAQQAKNYSSMVSDYDYYDDEYDIYEDDYSSSTEKIDASTFIIVLMIGLSYSLVQFNLIKLLVKHFENVAELKSIQKEALERSL